jgi:hypothetical protein
MSYIVKWQTNKKPASETGAVKPETLIEGVRLAHT